MLDDPRFHEYLLNHPHQDPDASAAEMSAHAMRMAEAWEKAVKAERARWAKVTAFAEPRGQYRLALKLCGDSDLSADDLITVLMAAPREMPLTGLAAHMARIVHKPGNA